MIHDENMEFFRKSDNTLAVSYSDFLNDRDIILYNLAQEIKSIPALDTKQTTIIDTINYTIMAINEYIDTDDYKYLFSDLPTESAIAIQKYIYKVINFFKSYKIDIFSINNIYKLDDESGKANIIDKMFINAISTKFDSLPYYDQYTSLITTMNREDIIKYLDYLKKTINLTYTEQIQPTENISIMGASINYTDVSIFNEIFISTTNLAFSDQGLNIMDKLWIKRV